MFAVYAVLAALTVVITDPTDTRLRQWLEARMRQRATHFALSSLGLTGIP